MSYVADMLLLILLPLLSLLHIFQLTVLFGRAAGLLLILSKSACGARRLWQIERLVHTSNERSVLKRCLDQTLAVMISSLLLNALYIGCNVQIQTLHEPAP